MVIGPRVLHVGVGVILFLGGCGKQGARRKDNEPHESQFPGLAVALTLPHGGVPGAALAKDHTSHTWFLNLRPSWRPGRRGSHFLHWHHFLQGWGMPERSPKPPLSWRSPSARLSHLFHPAIKPEVKYLLNDAIRPVAHYGVYLAINYGL